MTDYTKNAVFASKTGTTIEGADFDAEFDEIATAVASKENVASKGAANGYCGLDSGGLVAAADLPTATDAVQGAVELATDAETLTGTATNRAITPANLEAWAAQNAGAVKDLSDLADPGSDVLVFWDESANAIVFLTLGTNLSITDTTINASASASDLTSGTLPDARVAESNVTQHEAALTILETQITDGALLARLAAAESVTAPWAFVAAHTPPVAVTFSATAMAVDCALSNVFTTTFTANVTVAPTISNPKDGQTINWFITQDSPTGGRTMTWPTSFKWPGGSAGVLSTAASSVDMLVATYRASTGFWYCTLLKGFA